MLQKYDFLEDVTKWRVLAPFLKDPYPLGGGYGLRELSRITGISTPSLRLHLERLLRDKIVISQKVKARKVYIGNQRDERFRYLKKMHTIHLLYTSGCIEYLVKQCTPDVVILFGSASRGEDLRDSDIDLYLQSDEKDLRLSVFENALRRRVQLHFSSDFRKLPSELKNNLLNGVILDGYLKVF